MEDNDELREKVAALEDQVRSLQAGVVGRGVRKRSDVTVGGMPLYDIAIGPDPECDEIRGHARGFFAIGDIATGVVAIGGFARGLIALGGLAVGCVTVGGCSLGLLVALGGLAVGGVALGGAAVGFVAVGGGALGYYACGGGAFGKYVVTAARQDPEAVQFFGQFVPGLAEKLGGRG